MGGKGQVRAQLQSTREKIGLAQEEERQTVCY